MSNKSGSKNIIIAVLVLIALGLGGYVYHQQTTEPDLSIDISKDGLDIDTNYLFQG